ncbi:MAG TPA: helix-turn-helix domain-containing protein [Magnetospirillaceae bacterium]|nr:helix-turn-helix domain-containing protein [Magnetospirillaceae bacterium]
MAGAEVFAEKGYEAATMTEVAAKAGASIGSLYQFFPTKPLLAEALHLELLEKLTALLGSLGPEAAGRPAAVVVERLFARLGEFLEAHPAFATLAERRDIDKTRKAQTRALLRGLIAGLLTRAEPPVPPARAEAASVIVLHLIRAAVMLKESDEAPLRDAALVEMHRMLAAYFT